jgi:hypothetical protein
MAGLGGTGPHHLGHRPPTTSNKRMQQHLREVAVQLALGCRPQLPGSFQESSRKLPGERMGQRQHASSASSHWHTNAHRSFVCASPIRTRMRCGMLQTLQGVAPARAPGTRTHTRTPCVSQYAHANAHAHSYKTRALRLTSQTPGPQQDMALRDSTGPLPAAVTVLDSYLNPRAESRAESRVDESRAESRVESRVESRLSRLCRADGGG